eukprot:517840-Rhodomonas_salina.1
MPLTPNGSHTLDFYTLSCTLSYLQLPTVHRPSLRGHGELAPGSSLRQYRTSRSACVGPYRICYVSTGHRLGVRRTIPEFTTQSTRHVTLEGRKQAEPGSSIANVST